MFAELGRIKSCGLSSAVTHAYVGNPEHSIHFSPCIQLSISFTLSIMLHSTHSSLSSLSPSPTLVHNHASTFQYTKPATNYWGKGGAPEASIPAHCQCLFISFPYYISRVSNLLTSFCFVQSRLTLNSPTSCLSLLSTVLQDCATDSPASGASLYLFYHSLCQRHHLSPWLPQQTPNSSS